jgi:hypothetical protein
MVLPLLSTHSPSYAGIAILAELTDNTKVHNCTLSYWSFLQLQEL